MDKRESIPGHTSSQQTNEEIIEALFATSARVWNQWCQDRFEFSSMRGPSARTREIREARSFLGGYAVGYRLAMKEATRIVNDHLSSPPVQSVHEQAGADPASMTVLPAPTPPTPKNLIRS
jgi:hypothetical protein